MYLSFVAHEVAHAVAADNFAHQNPSLTTQEYIAAVVQLGSMTDDLRSTILSRFDGDGFDDIQQINLVLYAFDPAFFAVESYRHFLRTENGPRFIGELISGTTSLPDWMEY